MKDYAKLILFFCLSFIGIMAMACLLTMFQDSTALVMGAEQDGASSLSYLTYLKNAVPIAFYLAILLGLNYAFRRRMMYPVVFVLLFVCTLVLGTAVFVGTDSLDKMGVLTMEPKITQESIDKPELINRGTELKGPLFIRVDKDFNLSARVFSGHYKTGLFPFWIYIGSLALFLLSLGCLVNISYWALANLFFAILIYRGALALEAFLNQPNIHGMLSSFAGGGIPDILIIPFIFCALGALILLYSGLVYLARGRKSNG